MATEDTTVRTEEKSLFERSFRDWAKILVGKDAVKEIGEEVTLDYQEFDYVCQSCRESIAPTLDDFENWGKCPHCENRHTQAVKSKAGVSNLFSVLGIVGFLTVIGALIGPGLLLIGAYYAGKTNDLLRDMEHRVGQPVDGDGNVVEEVMEYIEDGWVIKSQSANGFTMERTSWGSTRMHAIVSVLFCWTLGWGNAVYAIVAHDSEKKFVQTAD